MFCPKCGSLLIPKKIGSKSQLTCSCGFKQESKDGGKIKESNSKVAQKFEVVDKGADDKSLPIADDVVCPKCENRKAYFWMIQTRASDEPETKFLKCVKCNHTWRDYS